MRILFIEPFYQGSHKKWLDDWVDRSQHEFVLYTLPGRHWKWRMEASAVHFADKYKLEKPLIDLILCSDFLNLGLFLGLSGIGDQIPAGIYFHENQLVYPWSENDPDKLNSRDRHYSFINYTSALAAQKVMFNSHYHQKSFIQALPGFLKAFPDKQGIQNVARIENKSTVLPLGFNFDHNNISRKFEQSDIPVLLWNHRWEYDKNPEGFFLAMKKLQAQSIPFKLIVCGEKTNTYPTVFDEAKVTFKNELVHFGYVESKRDYMSLLKSADIQFITGIQDFFGISFVEAMHFHVYPIFPNRLAYPEHIDEGIREKHMYGNEQEGQIKLEWACQNLDIIRKDTHYAASLLKYNWENLIEMYDEIVEDIISRT